MMTSEKVAFLVVSLLLATFAGVAYTSSDEEEPEEVPVHSVIAPSRIAEVQGRLARAIEDLERARTEPIAGLREYVQSNEARAVRLRELKERLAPADPGAGAPAQRPSRGHSPEVVRALAEAAERRIADLGAAAEELTLRGGVQSYHAKARLDWELEHLKDLAQRLDVPSSEIPANHFELLGKPELRELLGRWEMKHHALREAAALATPGIYARAIEESEAKLAAIKEAMDAPGVDLADRFFHAARKTIPEHALKPWFAAGDEASRAREISARELSSLEVAHARDGTDVGLLMRLRELEAAGDGALAREWRHQTLRRATALKVPDASSAVRQIIENRFADPLEALRAEAGLHHHWQQLSSSGSLDGVVKASFVDWMVSHLSVEDLAEVKAYVDEASAKLRAIDLEVPIIHQRRLDVDRRMIEIEADAIERELMHRVSSGGSRGPPSSSAKLDVKTLLIDPLSDGAARELRQSLYEAFLRYEARTIPVPVAKQLHAQLELAGYADEVSSLERDAGWVHVQKKVMRAKAMGVIGKRAARVREGLVRSSAYKHDPQRVQGYLQRLRDVAARSESPAVVRSAADRAWEGWQGLENLGLHSTSPYPTTRPYGDVTLISLTDEFQRVRDEAQARTTRDRALSALEGRIEALVQEAGRAGLSDFQESADIFKRGETSSLDEIRGRARSLMAEAKQLRTFNEQGTVAVEQLDVQVHEITRDLDDLLAKHQEARVELWKQLGEAGLHPPPRPWASLDPVNPRPWGADPFTARPPPVDPPVYRAPDPYRPPSRPVRRWRFR
ncbi:hypothetical protein WME94_55870 [Sorangium sp. So ce429]